METKKSKLISELETLWRLVSGADMVESQLFFYKRSLEDARDVKVVPLGEVLSKQQIEQIKTIINPQPKECYKNATLLSQYLNCTYVEGKNLVCGVFGTEHAFNRIGDKYVDITLELALGKDVTKEEYIVQGEWLAEECLDISVSRGVYGSLYAKRIADEYCEYLKTKEDEFE